MTSATTQIFLASTSPRRQELLEQIGVSFSLIHVEVSERQKPGETPEQFVCRMAMEKAQTGWAELQPPAVRPVLGADTVVVIDGEALGKPVDQQHGMAMLQRLSGRAHDVLTAVAICVSDGDSGLRQRLSRTRVRMRNISETESRVYWETGEPLDKAGGYAIQGRAAMFVAEIQGSYTGVVGLPLFETAELLAGCGVSLLEEI